MPGSTLKPTSRWLKFILPAALLATTLACAVLNSAAPEIPGPGDEPPPTASAGTTPPGTASARGASLEFMLEALDDLTAIQPYSGWRNSASSGEREALDYMQERLEEFTFLEENGLASERQEFNVILGTEIHQSSLEIVVSGTTHEVPADATRGPRDELDAAVRFDSDGSLDDNKPDPVSVRAETTAVLTPGELQHMQAGDVQGRILFLDYTLVDRVLNDTGQAASDLSRLINLEPAGLVLVTEFSNTIGESHGTFVGDNSALNWISVDTMPPVLYARIEDMEPAGISSMKGLTDIKEAHLTWDVDVRSPAESGNLAAFVPGEDSSRAIIFSAHIDSPNAPAAMDNGSGSVVLLEIMRYLDESETIPPVDLVFAWFGSEEIGLYGSYNFAAAHQDLIDRSLGVFNFDCLTRPLDGITAHHNLVGWSYARWGSPELAWANHLAGLASGEGIQTEVLDVPYIYSDNSAFTAYNLPNVNMIYQNEEQMIPAGRVWYAGHIHSPYDTVDLAAESGAALMEMAQLGIEAALNPPPQRPNMEIVPEPSEQVVYIGSRNEAAHISPGSFFDFNMLLGTRGFDVDHIPYGTAVTEDALGDADMVIVLPVSDYPIDDAPYDEAWSSSEMEILENYAREGGLLVITNSLHRLKYANSVYELNEDWEDMNALAGRFGASYAANPGQVLSTSVTAGTSDLLAGVSRLKGAARNTLGIQAENGETLMELNDAPTMVLLGAGEGEVLLLGDVGFLSSTWGDLTNQPFWEALAEYALE